MTGDSLSLRSFERSHSRQTQGQTRRGGGEDASKCSVEDWMQRITMTGKAPNDRPARCVPAVVLFASSDVGTWRRTRWRQRSADRTGAGGERRGEGSSDGFISAFPSMSQRRVISAGQATTSATRRCSALLCTPLLRSETDTAAATKEDHTAAAAVVSPSAAPAAPLAPRRRREEHAEAACLPLPPPPLL